MVVGSLALAAHGEARATRDTDLVADIQRGDGARLAAALGQDFYLEAQDADEAVWRRQSFSIIYMPEPFKVDVFVIGSSAFDREAFGRRQQITLEDSGASIFIQSAEDAVIAKLRDRKSVV